MLKDRLTQDIKAALLAGDKARAEVLKMIKSAILYEEVAKGVRDIGLSDQEIQVVLAREAKKRAESAAMYQKAEEHERADTERIEKEIIEEYLPQQLGDAELAEAVQQAIDAAGDDVQMGRIIGAVKAKVGQTADGSRIAAMVKQKLAE